MKRKKLICSCCGKQFHGYQDSYTHDTGFGTCPTCEKEADDHNREEMDKSIRLIRDNLNEKNRKHFESLSYEDQQIIVYKAFEENVLSYCFKKR